MSAAMEADTDLPSVLPLPCDDGEHWAKVRKLLDEEPPVTDLQILQERMLRYSCVSSLKGLQLALYGMEADFCVAELLQDIIRKALMLPSLRDKTAKAAGFLRMLRQGVSDQLCLPRKLGVSLLANMFLCTFDKVFDSMPGRQAMSSVSFSTLLASEHSHEVAKLRMFLHFFWRAGPDTVSGGIIIMRLVQTPLEETTWFESTAPLLPLEVADQHMGIEEDPSPDLASITFTGAFVGGGTLSGGATVEQIRFAMYPELCLLTLFCPCLRPDEAIQIVGAERFSTYTGYGFSMRFGGDYVDQAERCDDGNLRTCTIAIDALDMRGQPASVGTQCQAIYMLRELNKLLVAFTQVDDDAITHWPRLATGNWGCGAFGACAPLKALLQWAVASQCGRRLRYFPFEEGFGPLFKNLVRHATLSKVTVGQLLNALLSFAPVPLTDDDSGQGSDSRPPTKERKQLEENTVLERVFAKLGLYVHGG